MNEPTNLDEIPATLGDVAIVGSMLAMELALLHAKGPAEGVALLDEVTNRIHDLSINSSGRTGLLFSAIASGLMASEISGNEAGED